jgi:redox-sensitive bicupin YhaK (pirin superfamily)
MVWFLQMNTQQEIEQAFNDYKNGYLALHKGEMRQF